MPEKSRFQFTPAWLVAIVFCGIAIYLVARFGSQIQELDVPGGSKIVLRPGSIGKVSDVKAKTLAEKVRSGQQVAPEAPPAPTTSTQQQHIQNVIQSLRQPTERAAGPSEFVGTWTDRRSGAAYKIAQIPGGYSLSEVSNLYGVPVVTAAGSGTIKAGRFEFAYKTVMGDRGVGVLEMVDGSLQGQVRGMLSSGNLHLVRNGNPP